MTEVPPFNPVHPLVHFALPAPDSDLLPAIHRRITAGLDVMMTIQMVTGCDEADAQEVQAWVADDPHDHEPDPVTAMANECKRLYEFQAALYDRMTMEKIAW